MASALHGGPAALLGRPSLEDARGRSFRVCSWSSSASFLHGGAWGRSMDVGVRGRERGREEENRFCGGRVVAMAEVKEKTPPSADASPLVKLAWYGSEAFGKGVALFRGRDEREEVGEEEGETFGDSISRETAMAALRKDYDRSYFVTGIMSMGIYEEDCEFADPFVSFRGKKRFKQNVSNLGSFMEDVNLKILDWQESEDMVKTKWRFSCVLGLPWRPILAASGGTDHYFSKETGKIYKHVEKWDISPADGVRQLFKPNPKLRKGKSG